LIVQKQQKSEARLKEYAHSTCRLERDNLDLTKQIQHLSDELTVSRSYAEELMESAQDKNQKDWEERETMYKKVIRTLKKQVRTEEAMVSIGLYRTAVVEAKNKTAQCEQHEQEVKNLSSKVIQLEIQLEDRHARSGTDKTLNIKASPVKVSSNKENSFRLANVNVPPVKRALRMISPDVTKQVAPPPPPAPKTPRRNVAFASSSKINAPPPQRAVPKISLVARTQVAPPPPPAPKTPKTRRRNVSFDFSPIAPKSADRSQLRVSMVRAAGGRKALQEKLHQMRSPRAMDIK
jgi:hypothetical protein